MKNWNGKEKRRCPRHPINECVQLKSQDDLGKYLIHHYGYGENIGLGGIRVKLLRYKNVKCPEIKEGTKVQVRIPVWGTKHYLELSGQVVWYLQEKRGGNIGIQFLSNDNKEKEVLLFQLVENVQKKASGGKEKGYLLKCLDKFTRCLKNPFKSRLLKKQ